MYTIIILYSQYIYIYIIFKFYLLKYSTDNIQFISKIIKIIIINIFSVSRFSNSTVYFLFHLARSSSLKVVS